MAAATAAPSDTAGVLAPPPLILAATLAAGLAVDHAAGLAFTGAATARWVTGGALVLAAVALGVAALWRFVRVGTAVEPWHPSTTLITDGVFAHSRNPIYTAFVLIQAGIGLAAGGPFTLLALLPLALLLHFGVVRREERYLERVFGEPYRAYCRRVRRYL